MFRRLVPGLGRRRGARHVPMQQCLEPPGSATGRARRDRSRRRESRLSTTRVPSSAPFVDAQELQELLLNERVRIGAIVLGRSGELSRLRKDGLGIAPRPASISAAPSSGRTVRRGAEGDKRSAARSSRPIAAGRSLRASALDLPTRAARPIWSRALPHACRSTRSRAATERLLQVVADDLLELAQPVPGRALEPGGEALVQVGARCSSTASGRRHRGSGVPEAVGLVAGEVGEVGRIRSRRTRAIRLSSSVGSNESGVSSLTAPRWNTVPSTDAAVRIARWSAGRPSSRAASSAWIVEGTGRSERSDAATQRSSSRVSSRSSMSIATSSSAKSALPSAAPAIRDSASAASGARSSRFEISCRHSASLSGSSRIDVAFSLPPPQSGRVSSSSGPRDADQQDRDIAREGRDVLDQIEERRLAQWTSSNTTTSGLRPRERLEELPHRPEGLLARSARRAAESQRLGHALGDQLRLLLPDELRGDRRGLLARILALARATSFTTSASGQ